MSEVRGVGGRGEGVGNKISIDINDKGGDKRGWEIKRIQSGRTPSFPSTKFRTGTAGTSFPNNFRKALISFELDIV
jgi:hypothetical protein